MSVSAPERKWVGPSAPERLNILRNTKTIAIVGASDKPSRASYFVATYLLSSSKYKVYFVNPVAKEILGQPVYASLADLPEVPDLVEVFRKHDDLPACWMSPSPWARRPSGSSSVPGMRKLQPRRRRQG